MARNKKTQSDPTGQARNRKRATRALDIRLKRSERQIKKLFRDVPRQRRQVTPIQNQATPVYEYDISPAQIEFLNADVQRILNEELETQGDNVPPLWFWSDEIEPPYRQGTAEEVNRFNQLIAAGIIAGLITDPFVQPVPVEAVLQSQSYIFDLRNIIVRNYGPIKTLSERTASQVNQQINQGMAAGFTPTEITESITQRFDVARSSAKRIADTEINRAYNDAKLDADKRAADRTGLRAGVIHISALLTTTRPSHAARHGNAYTVEDQRQWWNTGSNRINCKCNTLSALIDSQGNVVQKQERDEIRAERKFFERE